MQGLTCKAPTVPGASTGTRCTASPPDPQAIVACSWVSRRACGWGPRTPSPPPRIRRVDPCRVVRVRVSCHAIAEGVVPRSQDAQRGPHMGARPVGRAVPSSRDTYTLCNAPAAQLIDAMDAPVGVVRFLRAATPRDTESVTQNVSQNGRWKGSLRGPGLRFGTRNACQPIGLPTTKQKSPAAIARVRGLSKY